MLDSGGGLDMALTAHSPAERTCMATSLLWASVSSSVMEELPGDDGHNVGRRLREIPESAPTPHCGSLLLTSDYSGFQIHKSREKNVRNAHMPITQLQMINVLPVLFYLKLLLPPPAPTLADCLLEYCRATLRQNVTLHINILVCISH